MFLPLFLELVIYSNKGIMKIRLLLIVVACFLSWTSLLAQSDQKSSGVVVLKMSKKKAEEPAENSVKKPVENNVSSATFRMTKPVTKNTPTQSQSTATAKVSTPGTDKVDWVSPTLNSINTSQSSYNIRATVYSSEELRVVNIFKNGTFVKNLIMDGTSSRTKVFILLKENRKC